MQYTKDTKDFNTMYQRNLLLLDLAEKKVKAITALSVANNLMFFGVIGSMFFAKWGLWYTIFSLGAVFFTAMVSYLLTLERKTSNTIIKTCERVKFDLDFVKSWDNI
jgi:hypothetical protein